MHAPNAAITLFKCNQTTIYKTSNSLDQTNAANLNKPPCQEIHSFHSSQKASILLLSDLFQVQNELYLDQTSKAEFEKCKFIQQLPIFTNINLL